MTSSTAVPLAPPMDLRFQESVCCCTTHIETLAKALLVFDVVSQILTVCRTLGTANLAPLPLPIIGIALAGLVFAYESRHALLALIVIRGILLAVCGLMLLLVFILGSSAFSGYTNDPLLVPLMTILVFVLVLLLIYVAWTFKVFLKYRRFLEEKANGGGSVPVYYSATGAHGTIPAPPGPAMCRPVPITAPGPVSAPYQMQAGDCAPPSYDETEKSVGIGFKQ